MAWMASQQELREHPMVARLARKLNITKAQAIGHLHMLWWWCLDFAPEGDLTDFEEGEIADAADWYDAYNPQSEVGATGASTFVQALLDCRWLTKVEGRLLVANWHERAGALMAYRERQRRYRNRLREDRTREGSDVAVSTPSTSKKNSTEECSTEKEVGHDAVASTTSFPQKDELRQLLKLLGASRFTNPGQQQAYEGLLAEVGKENFMEAARWAAARGLKLRDYGAIAKVARKANGQLLDAQKYLTGRYAKFFGTDRNGGGP